MLVVSKYLCKIFLRNASGPFYTELLKPTWIGDVCTLNQHSLHKNAILRGSQNALDRFLIIVSLRNKQKRPLAQIKRYMYEILCKIKKIWNYRFRKWQYSVDEFRKITLIVYSYLLPCFLPLKASELLNVCVEHSTQRRERCYQVVKFSPHKESVPRQEEATSPLNQYHKYQAPKLLLPAGGWRVYDSNCDSLRHNQITTVVFI